MPFIHLEYCNEIHDDMPIDQFENVTDKEQRADPKA